MMLNGAISGIPHAIGMTIVHSVQLFRPLCQFFAHIAKITTQHLHFSLQ